MQFPTELTIPQPPAPLSRTYWVVADQLLAGAYPGKLDHDEHLQRLTGLFDSGMRTFVNLMEEDESNNSGVPFVRYDDGIRDIASNSSNKDRSSSFSDSRWRRHDIGPNAVDP